MNEELAHSIFSEVLFPKESGIADESHDLQLRKNIRFTVDPEQMFRNLPWVVFDFETTGLDSEIDRVIEIGAQKLINNTVIEEYSTFIHTDVELSEVVQNLTGITPAMLEGQPHIEEVLPQFLSFIEGSILVAHNAEFDMSMLRSTCSRAGIDIDWPVFCTLKLARELLPDLERKNLDTLAEHYGLTFESRHRSIGDVKVTVRVLNEMLGSEGSYLKFWKDLNPFKVM